MVTFKISYSETFSVPYTKNARKAYKPFWHS